MADWAPRWYLALSPVSLALDTWLRLPWVFVTMLLRINHLGVAMRSTKKLKALLKEGRRDLGIANGEVLRLRLPWVFVTMLLRTR